jgi:hypothetical protein
VHLLGLANEHQRATFGHLRGCTMVLGLDDPRRESNVCIGLASCIPITGSLMQSPTKTSAMLRMFLEENTFSLQELRDPMGACASINISNTVDSPDWTPPPPPEMWKERTTLSPTILFRCLFKMKLSIDRNLSGGRTPRDSG